MQQETDDDEEYGKTIKKMRDETDNSDYRMDDDDNAAHTEKLRKDYNAI